MATRARSRRCSLCGNNHATADEASREACAQASLETYQAKVAALKEQFLASTAFAKVMDCFFQSFARDPAFLGMGELIRDDHVGAALAQVSAKLLGCSAETMNVSLLRLPEHQMTHGMLKFPEGFGVVLYFHDLEKGLLALNDAREGQATIYVRFQVHELPGGDDRLVH